MKYHWREGFHAPRGVSAEAVKKTLDVLSEPSPQMLLEASKKKQHPLHGELWSEGDQVWAQRGRAERCRHIISSIEEEINIGGVTIEIRSVEFLRVDGSRRWTQIEEIIDDPELADAYLTEIQRLQEQAAAKMAKFRELTKK